MILAGLKVAYVECMTFKKFITYVVMVSFAFGSDSFAGVVGFEELYDGEVVASEAAPTPYARPLVVPDVVEPETESTMSTPKIFEQAKAEAPPRTENVPPEAKASAANAPAIPISGYSRAQVQGDNPPRCRKHPISGNTRTHAGCDMAIGQGTGVRATLAGKVVQATYSGNYGNIITLEHRLPSGKKIYSRYAHLTVSGKNCKLPRLGTQMTHGQRIGCVGSTGGSTGPHLHFEIRSQATGGTVYDSKHFILSGGDLKTANICGGKSGKKSKKAKRSGKRSRRARG